MKLATWNVNSIKARQELVLRWIGEVQPDVLMIQELKGLDFPATEQFQTAGYHIETVPQKTYNGVATLSKEPVTCLHRSLPGFTEDEQARYQESDLDGLRLINIYAPNGNPVDSEKFPYKLKWLHHLYDRLCTLREDNIPFLLTGDFNIMPEDIDCYNPDGWKEDALFRPESRALFRQFCNLGLTDAWRVLHPRESAYTFWDYQGGAFPANKGLRIDHFLLSPSVADRLISCEIDVTPRGWDRPSDHTPVIIHIK
ncbi:MAG: exodeoxyribonuclease III [Rhodospirillales bacterium]|nr:exodeoxyribonuclease III [Rhodospirillales bacterium]MCB9973099.1 exodeoxyribonuclease III [Rhodospirillales bacterium]